jgi:SAM-dependent methyltransferase
MSGIYDNPWAYELACDFRDIPSEVDALLGWCDRHRSDRRPVRSVLELAAGPAEHAREFARRGVAATALDLSSAMCQYAAEQAKAARVELEVVEADMTDFDLGRRFDLVITMLDSTAHLMTLDAFVAHLGWAAAHLADEGLYILEMSHPADRLTDDQRVSTSWTFEHDDVRGSVRWGEPEDRLDPITQIVDDHVTITVHRGGDTQVIQGVVPYRFWTATELEAAVRLSGAFEMVAQYGDFDGDIPLSAPDAWRMITIFRPASGRPAGGRPAS